MIYKKKFNKSIFKKSKIQSYSTIFTQLDGLIHTPRFPKYVYNIEFSSTCIIKSVSISNVGMSNWCENELKQEDIFDIVEFLCKCIPDGNVKSKIKLANYFNCIEGDNND